MVQTPKDSIAFRMEKLRRGRLSPEARLKLVEPYLPQLPSDGDDSDTDVPSFPLKSPSRSFGKSPRHHKRKPLRTLLRLGWYKFVFLAIHLCFSIYVRLRQSFRQLADRVATLIWYHYQSADQIAKDVSSLGRLPKHLSVVLHYVPEREGGLGLTGLIEGAAEVAAWAAAAGIEHLSIYEKRGLLKRNIAYTQSTIRQRFQTYFQDQPTISLRAPQSSPDHSPFSSPPRSPDLKAVETSASLASPRPTPHLQILLISEEDSRTSIVDLTRTLTTLSQAQKLQPDDINVSLLDNELTETVMGEPDLLLLFGPSVKLEGYPVWQIRLAEIFHKRDVWRRDGRVNYQVFLKGLRKFSKAELRRGK